MICHHINARDLSDAWFQLVDLCYSEGRDYEVTEGSYAHSQWRRELDYVTFHIRQPWSEPLLPEIPPGLGIPNPVPEGMEYVNRYLPYLMTDEKKPGEQYTYGQRLFSEMNISGDGQAHMQLSSQIEEVIEKFKRGFGNNQACMTVAVPQDVHLSHPPCLRQIDCRIYSKDVEPNRGDAEKLHFVIYFRSWDIFAGMPANLAALVHLQEYMAESIGVQQGEFVCSSKGAHLYSQYWPLAKIRLGEK